MEDKRTIRVGDVVMIRGDLTAGLDFEGIHIFSDQAALIGTCGKVREIDGDAVRVGRWWWHRDALWPVDGMFILHLYIFQSLHVDLLKEENDLLRRENEILRCYA